MSNSLIRASLGYSKWMEKKECNGCGSGWTIYVIPNTIYGMNIRDCCCPHDYDYELGETIEEKEASDRRFRNNMYRKIDADAKWWRNNKFVKRLMRRRAKTYYQFVDEFGASAFWDGKHTGEELIKHRD